MTPDPSADPVPLSPDEQAVADRLQARPPQVSPSLRRRVRARIGLALTRRALRRRSVLLVSGGTALLLTACVLALTAPR